VLRHMVLLVSKNTSHLNTNEEGASTLISDDVYAKIRQIKHNDTKWCGGVAAILCDFGCDFHCGSFTKLDLPD